MEAVLLLKYEQFRTMGESRDSAIDALHEVFKELWTKSSIEQKIAKWSGKKTDSLKKAARDVLLQQVKQNKGIFEQYGLL